MLLNIVWQLAPKLHNGPSQGTNHLLLSLGGQLIHSNLLAPRTRFSLFQVQDVSRIATTSATGSILSLMGDTQRITRPSAGALGEAPALPCAAFQRPRRHQVGEPRWPHQPRGVQANAIPERYPEPNLFPAQDHSPADCAR